MLERLEPRRVLSLTPFDEEGSFRADGDDAFRMADRYPDSLRRRRSRCSLAIAIQGSLDQVVL